MTRENSRALQIIADIMTDAGPVHGYRETRRRGTSRSPRTPHTRATARASLAAWTSPSSAPKTSTA